MPPVNLLGLLLKGLRIPIKVTLKTPLAQRDLITDSQFKRQI